MEGKIMEQTLFQRLAAINCKPYVETRKIGGTELSYLSWAHAWSLFCQHVPGATYEVLRYDQSQLGYMVHTNVTAENITHEMWLPVLDGANKALKTEAYTYTVYNKFEKKFVEKTVEAINIFDINTAQMRCLVKNLAMFGLGINIYAGEDLPLVKAKEEPETKIKLMKTEDLKKLFATKKDTTKLPENICSKIEEVLANGTEEDLIKMQKYLVEL